MTTPIPVQPVIMAGGSGTRLWPLSRAGYPKQFLVLTADNRSLFQQAVQRLQGLAADDIALAAPLTVGNEEHRFLVLDQLREAGGDPGTVVLEPSARNTAPAMTLAALQAAEGGADPVLVVVAADHTMADLGAFTRALQAAVREAARGAIVVLGITPDRPETGYGYIRSAADGDGRCAGRAVRREARPRHRRTLPGRRPLQLEQRHVRRARLGLAGRAGALPPRHRRGHAHGLGRAQHRCALRAPGQGRVRRGAGRIGRLRGDGTLPRQRLRHPHGAAGRRLERPRRLGRRVASGREGRRRQRRARRRDGARQPQHPGARHQPPGRRGRRAGRDGDRDPRRGAGGRPRAQPGREEDRRHARSPGPRREDPAPQGAPPLGLVRQHRCRAALPGQAHHGQARRQSLACRCTTTAPSTGSSSAAPPR